MIVGQGSARKHIMTNTSYIGTVGNVATLVIGFAFLVVSTVGIIAPAQAAPVAAVHTVAR
jgi:hypothetical protein